MVFVFSSFGFFLFILYWVLFVNGSFFRKFGLSGDFYGFVGGMLDVYGGL